MTLALPLALTMGEPAGIGGDIALIPHCVDTAQFFPQPADELRGELGLEGFVVGYLGRLTEEKGLRELMAAADMLWEEGELDLSVALVGSGPLEAELRRWADSKPAGRVALTGPIAHPQAPALGLLVLLPRVIHVVGFLDFDPTRGALHEFDAVCGLGGASGGSCRR